MALLRDKASTPPDGWRYVQLETGCEIHRNTASETVDAIIAHRKHKGLPLSLDRAEVWIELQQQICSGLGNDHCHAEPGETWRPVRSMARTLTLGKMMAFSRGLLAFFTGGAELVEKDKAKVRGDICRGCRFNVVAQGCSCDPFYKLIAATIPKDRQQKGLNICAACGCSLQAKVNLTSVAVHESNRGRDIVFPGHCWQPTA